MNYYPGNFYQNYPPQQYYNNQYQTQQNILNNTIQGKMVENRDMVKVSEVPFGGYGVFPKTDFSEVYIKNWTPNGTTQIQVYKLVDEEEKNQEPDINTILLEKITAIESKLEELNIQNLKPNNTSIKPAEDVKKKGVIL